MRFALKALIVVLGLLPSLSHGQTILDDNAKNIPSLWVGEAMYHVMDKLFDPQSSQFRRIGRPFAANGIATSLPTGDVIREDTICGFFNAKNLHGAYVGFRRFAYDTFTKTVFIYQTEEEAKATGEALSDDLRNVRMGSQFTPLTDAKKDLAAACELYIG